MIFEAKNSVSALWIHIVSLHQGNDEVMFTAQFMIC